MSNPQTEAQTSLWVPAKPEHAKLGWTYDFEQTERISRAAYDSTGYEATMEVVEFVMAEADRRHRTALAAKDAELAAVKVSNNKWLAKWERAEAQLAEANKALEPFARIADDYTDEEDDDFQVWKDFDVLGATLPLKHFRAGRQALANSGGPDET